MYHDAQQLSWDLGYYTASCSMIVPVEKKNHAQDYGCDGEDQAGRCQ